MAEGNLEEVIQKGTTYGVELPNSIYLRTYSQQFTLAFVWNILFRICGTTEFIVIEYANAICNGITVIAIYLITRELSKKYDVNKYLSVVMILTFIAVPALAVFVYGDLSSLAFSLLSIYFIMRYTRKNKIEDALYSALFMLIAYMLRMNVLIFIMGVVIYLILDIISEKKEIKKTVIKILIILGFIIISMLPTELIKNHFCNICSFNKSESFPTLGYLYMGMSEKSENPGWFNFRQASHAYYRGAKEATEIYKEGISERLNYFSNNIGEAVDFYIRKTASMWTENTYGAVIYNISDTFISADNINEELDEKVLDAGSGIQIYQKALVLIIFGGSILIIIQNRKNISNEVLLLLMIFIGGFLFHTMWEAKSRYIIPYIVVLIPIVGIKINRINIKEKIRILSDRVKSLDKQA